MNICTSPLSSRDMRLQSKVLLLRVKMTMFLLLFCFYFCLLKWTFEWIILPKEISSTLHSTVPIFLIPFLGKKTFSGPISEQLVFNFLGEYHHTVSTSSKIHAGKFQKCYYRWTHLYRKSADHITLTAICIILYCSQRWVFWHWMNTQGNKTIK